jgi:ferredoxin
MSEPQIEVEIDRDRCMSSAACISLAPGTFALDEEGVSTVRSPTGDDADAIVDAVESCPVRAIRARIDGREV